MAEPTAQRIRITFTVKPRSTPAVGTPTGNDGWGQPQWDSPALRSLRIEFADQVGPHWLKLRGQLRV